ncbi:hypothetical protein Tco_1431008 [Tanacetum coccineum]
MIYATEFMIQADAGFLPNPNQLEAAAASTSKVSQIKRSIMTADFLEAAGYVQGFLLVVPAGRLCGSYWSAYGFFCLPCPILFVYAASIVRYWSSDALGS